MLLDMEASNARHNQYDEALHGVDRHLDIDEKQHHQEATDKRESAHKP
jgi:hypothetical protein